MCFLWNDLRYKFLENKETRVDNILGYIEAKKEIHKCIEAYIDRFGEYD